MITLLSNATVNGAGTEFRFEPLSAWPKTLQIWGTFDGATVTIEVSPDEVQWNPLPDGAFTAADVKDLKISTEKIRAVISGAGASTNLNAAIT